MVRCATPGILYIDYDFIFAILIRAGQTAQIVDTSDTDWWQGRCTVTGSLGYLPSTYLARLMPGERVFRVNQHCQMENLRGELVSLDRDQVNINMANIELYLIFYPGCYRNVERVPREYKPG